MRVLDRLALGGVLVGQLVAHCVKVVKGGRLELESGCLWLFFTTFDRFRREVGFQ